MRSKLQTAPAAATTDNGIVTIHTGQEKGGDPDLSSNSGQDYMRCFFNLQECGTDEVASTWLSTADGDRTVIGNANPDFFGGFGSTLLV